MTPHPMATSWSRRARRSFWILVWVAVLSAGALSAALAAEPSPLTGLRVVGSGLVLVSALALAARVMIGIERARRRTSGAGSRRP
jgi:hypothetical protein